MPGKIRLVVLFGGRSCEHEVSVISARSMLAAMNRDRYDITLVGIDKAGRWLGAPDSIAGVDAAALTHSLESGEVVDKDLVPVALKSERTGAPGVSGLIEADVVFPLLHGPNGEDGTIQGLLELADVAYVGSGVLGASVAMDKAVCKRLMTAHGLPQTPWHLVEKHLWADCREQILDQLVEKLCAVTFVKPANMGSSIGVTRATGRDELALAIDHAATFDTKVIVEAEAANCREVECAVLGNNNPEASVVGEIIPGATFYDYNDKYFDGQSRVEIPAAIADSQAEKIRAMAIDVFKATGARGLARVDFFASRDSEAVYVNEINTMPGFTPISMYPKLWEASGLAYPDLVDRLIALAIERHEEKAGLKTSLDTPSR